MKSTSTLPNSFKRFIVVLMTIVGITTINAKSYAQSRIYANQVTVGNSPGDHVDNANNASLSNNNFARVKSNAGLILGAGAYSGELELKFPTTLPAGTTSYIRINVSNPDLLNTLLGGSLGGLLADITGSIVLGNRYFNVGARMGTGSGNNVVQESSANGFSNQQIKLIKDAAGYFYVAITPTANYDRVFIKDHVNAVLGLGASSYTDVYYAFYGTGTDPCEQGFSTGFDGSGLSVDLLKLGGAGVTNPERVIDANANNFSRLSLGIIGVAATVSQDVYFETLSKPGDEFNVKLQADPALINLGLLNNLSIKAYNGQTEVFSGNLSSILDLDLLGLLNSGEPVALPFKPTAPFNRVRISIQSLVGVGLTQYINLYSVIRSAPRPTFSAPASNAVTICAGSTASLTATTSADNELRWYDSPTGGTGVTVAYNAAFVTPVLTANKTYYVAAKNKTCTAESARVPVTVTMATPPSLPEVTTNGVTISAGQTATLSATTTGGNTIKWYAAATGGTALATGMEYTTPALNTTTTYYVGTENAGGCASSTRVPVTVTVITGPVNPDCRAAVAQQTGIRGLLCALCSIQGSGNSTDNNPNNFTKINLAVGVGAVGYQRLIFASPGAATDSIRLDLATPVGLADLSVLGGITIRVMNGNSVVSTQVLNSSLINLQVLSGNRFKATFAAGAIFDRVEVSFGALVSALSNLSIYGAEIIYPNPTIAAAGLNICSGNTTVLNATANGGTTLAWYSGATGGTLLHTGSTFTTPVLNTTTTYYIEVSKAGCTNPERFPVKVTVTNTPATPVVAAVPTVCAGSTAVITVSSPVTGVTYSWYTTATGGTSIATGPQFTTPAVTANTTYYVEASNGTCVNSTRRAVAITTKPLPALPQVQTSATTVNSGQTAVLTATSPEADITFNWYTSANSTTPVYTGPVFITPPLTATTTYYVEAVSPNGCPAASRVQVTITVSGTGTPNPVPCEAATTQTNGVAGGVSIFAGVFNPLLAIDDDAKTGSSLVVPVGLLGTTVYQRIGYTTLSNIGDTVRVLLSSPGKLLSLGVLSNITIGTYSGNTNNNDAVSLLNALIRLELLSGSSEALISFVPTKQFDKVDIRLNAGLAGALTSININYVQRVLVAPTVAASNVNACLNQTAVLTVQNPKAGLIYKWYDAAGVYQTGKDGPTFTTPVITVNTTYYVTANTAGGCASEKTPVSVTVTLPPATPVLVSPTVNTCAGSDAVLEVSNPLSGIIYKWYNSAGVYQAGKDGPTFTVTGVTSATTYSVEAVNSCGVASAKATATISVGTINSPTVVPAAATVSSGTPAVLTASSGTAGAVFSWYDSATSTTPVFVGPRFETAPLVNNGTTPTTVTYYVEAAVPGGCPASARTSVVITIIPAGTGADVPCERATAQVRSGADGVALFTGVFNPALAVDNNSETASSLVMPVGVLGASVYQHVRFDNLSAVGDTLRVRVSSPGKLLSAGVLPAIELTTFNGLTSNNDTYLANNPLVKVELLSDNSGAIFSFVPTKQFNGVELRLRAGVASALTSLNFNYAQLVIKSPQVLSASASACVGSSATLTVRNPVDGLTYRWYRGNTYLTGKDGTTLMTDPTLAAGVYDYFVTASRNGCESARTKVVVTILTTPALPVPTPGNPTVACFNAPVILKVNDIAGVQFNWYDEETGGNLLATNTNTYTTGANLAPGTYNFYVEAINSNNCGSTAGRTKITLTVNSTSVAADISIAGLSTAYCAGTSATLTASSTTVPNPTFTWYTDAALTNPVFTGAIFKTPLLTANVNYYVTVRGDGRCENLAGAARTVVVNVNPPAVAADISVSGAGSPVCAPATVVLTATSSTIANPVFTWYSDAELTTAVHTGATFTTPVLNANATYYVTVQSATRCENTAATARVVKVTVNPIPVTPVVSTTGTNICSGDPAILSIQNAQTGVLYTWYDAATGGSVLFTGPEFNTGPLSANKDYYVSATSPSGCGNATGRVKVTVTVSAKPAAPTVASNALSVCTGNTATITVSNPQPGVTYSYYPAATGGTALGTGNTYTTGAITAATTIYVGAATPSCSNATRTKITITPVATPIAPVEVTGAATKLCNGSYASLSVQNPVAAVIYRWYSTATGGTAIAEGATFTTPALSATTTYYVEASNTAGCSSATRTAVTVTVASKLEAPVVTVQSATSTSVTFGWNAVDGATGYEVSVDNGLTWISPGSASSTSYTVSGLQSGERATIRVRAIGELDCQLSDATTLTGDTDNPLENMVFIPNTFTPNHDGKNDVLLVFGNSIAKLKLRVYNQWGQFLYESLNIQHGWDGTYRGVMQPNGVYVYYAEVEFNDGSKVNKKGTVTLLR